MTKERAMEILDPEHREDYDGIEEVNEACRMGMEAIRKQIKMPVIPREGEYDAYKSASCPCCRLIHDEYSDEWGNKFCSDCGQALDWDCTEGEE